MPSYILIDWYNCSPIPIYTEYLNKAESCQFPVSFDHQVSDLDGIDVYLHVMQ